ncbi:SDR family oxidoreductase [Actinocorallia aurea]
MAADLPDEGKTMGLEGARVLVSGASAGIGRAFAVGAVRAGARVVLAARRQAELDKACDEAGGGLAVAVDLTEPDGPGRIAAAVREELGGLDLVVSCVGVAPLKMLVDTDDADWERVFAANVVGTHRLLKACLPLLDASAMVMALSSETVVQPRTGLGAYAASKAALERLLVSWRTEHPWKRFTTVTIGATFPTDFGNGFEGDILMRALEDWGVRGLAQEQMMDPQDVADVLLGTAATALGRPGVCLEHLTVRSPSPVVGTFADSLAPFSGETP